MDVYKSVIKKHDVKKEPFENSVIERLIDQVKVDANNVIKLEIQKDKVKPKLNKTAYILILGVLTLLTASFYLFQNYKTGTDKNQAEGFEKINDQTDVKQIKEAIYNYYEALKGNNSEALGYFINNKVDRWYGKYNVSLMDIQKDNIRYFKKYPSRDVEIKWDNFKMFELPNGDFNVNYEIIYRLKTDFQNEYKTYNLNIHSIWTPDFKIKSMYEDKI